MKWTVDRQLLTLTCKVHRMVFSVSFNDPLNQEVAYCFQPIPTSACYSHYKNGSVYIQLATNETVFVLRGKIFNKINGNWTCLHGAMKDRTSIRIHLTGESGKKIHCVTFSVFLFFFISLKYTQHSFWSKLRMCLLTIATRAYVCM